MDDKEINVNGVKIVVSNSILIKNMKYTLLTNENLVEKLKKEGLYIKVNEDSIEYIKE